MTKNFTATVNGLDNLNAFIDIMVRAGGRVQAQCIGEFDVYKVFVEIAEVDVLQMC